MTLPEPFPEPPFAGFLETILAHNGLQQAADAYRHERGRLRLADALGTIGQTIVPVAVDAPTPGGSGAL